MTKQQGSSRLSVVLGITFLVVAVGLFGAAFYFFDGMSLVDSILNGESAVADGTASAGDDADDDGSNVMQDDPPELALPAGMPESFALRVWQEQIDSQSNIARLVSGEVSSIEITSTAIDGDSAVLSVNVVFSDGTEVPGAMGMSRFDDKWYFTYVHEDRVGSSVDSDMTDLPDVDDVDIDLLNTIISEQAASSEVMEEYATGVVSAVSVTDVVEGPDTVTLKLDMTETHEDGTGEVVVISRDVGGKQTWFVAKFTKTDSVTE